MQFLENRTHTVQFAGKWYHPAPKGWEPTGKAKAPTGVYAYFTVGESGVSLHVPRNDKWVEIYVDQATDSVSLWRVYELCRTEEGAFSRKRELSTAQMRWMGLEGLAAIECDALIRPVWAPMFKYAVKAHALAAAASGLRNAELAQELKLWAQAEADRHEKWSAMQRIRASTAAA